MILGQSKPWARGEDLLMGNRMILGWGRPWERGEDLLTKNRIILGFKLWSTFL